MPSMKQADLPFRVLPEPSFARGFSGGLALSLAVHATAVLLLGMAAMYGLGARDDRELLQD